MKDGIILAAFADLVQHMSCGDDCTAIDMNAHVRIDACVGAGGTGGRKNGAAIDHQPAVGIDAITFAGLTVDADGQIAAVDGGDGNAIFVGIDAIVAGVYENVAAIDGQVQFTVQTFVFGADIQDAGVFRAAKNIHRPSGVKRAVVFVQFIGVFHLCFPIV